MICSLLNLDRFIVRLLVGADSTSNWRGMRGSDHTSQNEVNALAVVQGERFKGECALEALNSFRERRKEATAKPSKQQ